MSEKLLAFDIWGDYGYFRRGYTSTSTITYPFPSRTTIAGLISGIVGLEKDSYHDFFNENNSKIGLRILNPIKKMNINLNYINTKEYNPLTIDYMPFYDYLDISLMEEAIHLFEGTHDFKGFASASIDERKDTVKTIFQADMNILDGKVEFIFVGTAFLKYQIRRMMGLLIDIGRGYYKKDKILEVLEKKDPSISHRVIEPTGLYLYKVTY